MDDVMGEQGTLAQENAWLRTLRGLRRPRDLARLRVQLVVPYALLTLLVAMVGLFVTVRLVSAKVNERFQNALAEAGRVAEDGIVAKESDNLETLRQMAFTQGVAEALVRGDSVRLNELLLPLVANRGVETVAAINAAGEIVLTIGTDPSAGPVTVPAPADLTQLEAVARVLRGDVDAEGDKYSGLLTAAGEPYLFTVAPVTREGERMGALVIATRLDVVLNQLYQQSLADLIVLDSNGQLVATTLAAPGGEVVELTIPLADVPGIDTTPTRILDISGREYEVLYTTLELRRRPVGVLGVALSRDYVVSTETTSRDTIVAIFALLVLAVSLLGVVLARAITRPILRLREVSQAVAAGDLEQQTGLNRPDEIGDLATAFDQMTLRLRERTREAARLHDETNLRNTELVEAYGKLKHAQRQLVRSEKLSAIGHLTAGLVHDVKNPLTKIKGLAELMEETSELEAADRQHVMQIVEQADRANRVVSDLMKFARQSEHEMTPGDYCSTVEAVVRLNSYLAREANVQITVDTLKPSIMAIYDQGQIEQVLVNLVQNAIQSMPGGGRLRINLSQVGQTVAIAVQDSGQGIQPEDVDRVFDPFFTTKPAGEGTGLGLAVSYGIVAGHGGKIEVDSVPGFGTTFTVLLPVDPTFTVFPRVGDPSIPSVAPEDVVHQVLVERPGKVIEPDGDVAMV